MTVAAREKIHVRETAGRYTSWRWACVWMTQLVFFGLPWLNWDGRPAVLFDMVRQKAYFFGIVLWPQDLIYFAALLIVGSFTIFLLTAMVGRIWCGFACPHTVYSEIFMWIERKIEGGRSARMRLDNERGSLRKFGKKAIKHGAWVLIAFWIGFTFVGYFTPIQVLWSDLLTAALSSWQLFWISSYGLLAYGNAGWMREQICRYICPYSRLQSAMVDKDTLLVTYDSTRGEPRGLRNRKYTGQTLRRGDCIDCTICVQVCPTGSDIRQGFLHDCMGCAACIDACNLVMDKIGAARGLISYATGNEIDLRLSPRQVRRRIWRPRLLIYMAMLVVLMMALAGSLITRVPLKLDVNLDRGALRRGSEQGQIENVYQLHIVNTDERAHRYRISVSGVDTIALAASDDVMLEGTASRVVPVRVRVAPGNGTAGSNEIMFEVQDHEDGNLRVKQKAVFVVPIPGARVHAP